MESSDKRGSLKRRAGKSKTFFEKMDQSLETEMKNTGSWLIIVLNKLISKVEKLECDIKSFEISKRRKYKAKLLLDRHLFHIVNLKSLLFMVEHRKIDIAQIEKLKHSVEYYLESPDDTDFHDEELYADIAGLEEGKARRKRRFSHDEKKKISNFYFESHLRKMVDMNVIDKNKLKSLIARKIEKLTKRANLDIVDLVYRQFQNKMYPDPMRIVLELIPFLNVKHIENFINELWESLLSDEIKENTSNKLKIQQSEIERRRSKRKRSHSQKNRNKNSRRSSSSSSYETPHDMDDDDLRKCLTKKRKKKKMDMLEDLTKRVQKLEEGIEKLEDIEKLDEDIEKLDEDIENLKKTMKKQKKKLDRIESLQQERLNRMEDSKTPFQFENILSDPGMASDTEYFSTQPDKNYFEIFEICNDFAVNRHTKVHMFCDRNFNNLTIPNLIKTINRQRDSGLAKLFESYQNF